MAAIGYAIEGSAAFVTLRRPEKQNALTGAMVREILDAVARAEADDDVKLIVLRGEGRSFCAGFDVTDPEDFEGAPGEPRRARIASLREKSEWMRRLLSAAKPLVVAVHGSCIGIGMYLLLVADFAIASDDAGIGMPEERFGSAGATWAYPFLILNVGLKRANEIVMTGRRLSADEAAQFGLVNRVVPRERLDAEVADLARALGSLPRDGIAVNRAARQLALASTGHLDAFAFHAAVHPLAEHLHREGDEFDFMRAIEKDGMRAALAERNRRFGGGWWGW
jgi:enoyl-CoA hydratase